MALRLRLKEEPAVANRPLSRLFDVRQLAERWNVSERTVRRLMEGEAFAVTRIGRRVLVSEAQVALFEAKNTQGVQ